MKKSSSLLALCSLGLSVAHGQILIDPVADWGLSDGDTFRVMFVSSSTAPGTLTLEAYNNLITTDASGLSFSSVDAPPSWNAIIGVWGAGGTPRALSGTEPGVDLDPTAGILRTDGALIASSYADLWDASIEVPVSLGPDGTDVGPINRVWTGAQNTGLMNGNAVGRDGRSVVAYGSRLSTVGGWAFGGNADETLEYRVYGISSLMTVSDLIIAIPEPGHFGLLAGGLLWGLVFLRRRL
jgi:hypothetical protein